MRKLLILSLSLVMLMMLAHVQPRPAQAQANEYWLMRVDEYFAYSHGPTNDTITLGSADPVVVPTGNIWYGMMTLHVYESGSGGQEQLRLANGTINATDITATRASTIDQRCYLRESSASLLSSRCITFRATAAPDLPATPNNGPANGNILVSSNPLSAGDTITYDVQHTRSGCGSCATLTGYLGISHLIFYGPPPIDACFVPSPGEGTAPLTVTFVDCSTPPEDILTWDWYIDEVFYSDEQDPDPYEFTDPGTYFVTLVVNEGESNEDSVTLPIAVHPPEGLVRPFTAAEEGVPSGGIDAPEQPLWLSISFADVSIGTGFENTVTGFSKSHSIVHAAKTGTVASIKVLDYGDCDTSSDSCYVLFGEDISGAFGGIFNGYVFEYLMNEVYVVTLETAPGNYLAYLVTNPYLYTNVGETVSKGCPLGESIPLLRRQGSPIIQGILNFVWQGIALLFDKSIEDVQTTLGQVAGFQPGPSAEFTVITDNVLSGGTRVVVPIIDQLIEYTEDEPRSCEYQPSACLSADPELRRPELWSSVGPVDWFPSGGAILSTGARISMQLSLDSEEDYVVETWARTFIDSPGQLSVQLGQTLTPFTTSPNFQQFIIPSGSHTPDLGLFYTLSISNTGNAPVLIQSICVRDENNGSSRPPACYFTNPSFDGLPAAQGWDTTGTVNDGLIPGEIIMYDGDTISQNAQLYPDGIEAHIYFVTVTATVGGADIATLQADSTSEVGFEYEFPAAAGFEPYFGPNSADTYPVSGFFTGVDNGITFLPDNQIVFYANLTVSSFENSDFTIRAVVESENPNLFVRVREVCIDDPFLHHDEDDAWIPEPPFEPNCVGISPPQGNDIGAWIFYHWSQLDRFFQCDLIILLNRMHDTAQSAYKLIGWQFRYWQSTLLMFTRWLSSDLIYWLNGHFRNMAVGQVTTIESAPGASLWDVLLALINVVLGPIVDAIREIITVLLGIITQVVNLLFTIITAIITLVLAIMLQLINLFGLAQQLLVSIITAYNTATPTPLPGMEDCTANPQANSWCKSLWVLENTIFSGPAGSLIIPLLTAVLSIHLILFVIGELKRMVISVGQSS